MNRNLFLAILSLDYYNRGYDANVGGLGGLGAKIGGGYGDTCNNPQSLACVAP